MIRYFTAGESHGKCATVIIEGIPAGLEISKEYINIQLARRQQGYGRGKRMEIETDKVEFTSGVRWGQTIGSPVCMIIKNKDWENWMVAMSDEAKDIDEKILITRSRPGHADLAGVLKYNRKDVRDILERASARETAARVAAGAIARKMLEELKIGIISYTDQVGGIKADCSGIDPSGISAAAENSPLRCPDKKAEKKMIEEIDSADRDGDTVGGAFTVIVTGVPAGFGSHTQWDLRLDGRIAQAIMAIQAIKGVESGCGFEMASLRGSKVHDEIKYDKENRKFYRSSNNAGGIEGGITNGENIIFRAAMKPISSLKKPLMTVDLKTKEIIKSEIIRSDVCAVPAAGVIAESVVAIEIAKAIIEKTGGDSMAELKRNYTGYIMQMREF